MVEDGLIEAAGALIDLCRSKKLSIVTAESCTGGLLAATLTEIPGSSDVFERGFVTYSNEAKHTMLGIPLETLTSFGAVSRETARAMAVGALAHAPVELAVAVTGIAGPQGAVAGKPVGLVHFAAIRGNHLIDAERCYGAIGRGQIRRAAIGQALALLRELAEGE